VGFNDWIQFEPAQMAALDNEGEVEQVAMDTLAKELQMRLRTTIDPGINLRSAVRAQSIRVSAEGDRLVIDQEDQADILGDASEEKAGGDNDVTNVEQLFEMGSGVPTIVNGRLTYRTVTAEALFGDQKKLDQERVVEQAAADVIRNRTVDAFDEAMGTVARKSINE
jgi:hypothetical protein